MPRSLWLLEGRAVTLQDSRVVTMMPQERLQWRHECEDPPSPREALGPTADRASGRQCSSVMSSP